MFSTATNIHACVTLRFRTPSLCLVGIFAGCFGITQGIFAGTDSLWFNREPLILHVWAVGVVLARIAIFGFFNNNFEPAVVSLALSLFNRKCVCWDFWYHPLARSGVGFRIRYLNNYIEFWTETWSVERCNNIRLYSLIIKNLRVKHIFAGFVYPSLIYPLLAYTVQ